MWVTLFLVLLAAVSGKAWLSLSDAGRQCGPLFLRWSSTAQSHHLTTPVLYPSPHGNSPRYFQEKRGFLFLCWVTQSLVSACVSLPSIRCWYLRLLSSLSSDSPPQIFCQHSLCNAVWKTCLSLFSLTSALPSPHLPKPFLKLPFFPV